MNKLVAMTFEEASKWIESQEERIRALEGALDLTFSAWMLGDQGLIREEDVTAITKLLARTKETSAQRTGKSE